MAGHWKELNENVFHLGRKYMGLDVPNGLHATFENRGSCFVFVVLLEQEGLVHGGTELSLKFLTFRLHFISRKEKKL